METLLEKIEDICGLTIQWKFVGTGKTSCGLSEKHTYHRCEFCRKIKQNRDLLRLCSQNDTFQLPRRAEEEKKPFISTCHAGVSELVIPLFDGERCREVFLAGIFRTESGASPYPFMEREFRNLPVRNAEKLKLIQDLLKELSPILREHRDSRGTDGGTGIQDSRILQTVAHIDKNFAERIRIKELARKVCLSESRFLHLFRKETGFSVVAYLTQCRLKAARQMLEIAGISIQEVMEQCGFRDQSRFGKLFREYTGCSPLVYHKKFRRRRDV